MQQYESGNLMEGDNKVTPLKIQSYFVEKQKQSDGENTIVSGHLQCCNSQDFEVLIFGEVKKHLFSNPSLYPKNDCIALAVRCKKCGRVITVFNSTCDGYENVSEKRKASEPLNIDFEYRCGKCSENNFSIEIKYEYPDIKELKDLEISNIDNAFTWIWITIKCNHCCKTYKNFISFETA